MRLTRRFSQPSSTQRASNRTITASSSQRQRRNRHSYLARFELDVHPDLGFASRRSGITLNCGWSPEHVNPQNPYPVQESVGQQQTRRGAIFVSISTSGGETARLKERIDAVTAFVDLHKRLVMVGDLNWDAAWSDLRLFATNYILRRQLEALDASVIMARNELGHLAVGLVRPALDEVLWMSWLRDLPTDASQRLLNVLGQFDTRRSLLAQREFVGDDVMLNLWYPIGFLDAQAADHATTKRELAKVAKEFGWSGGQLPSAGWIAERSGKKDLYDYLHAATSRALHFSVGEINRQGWGAPGGIITTKKQEFREYRASFALYQLPVLFAMTIGATEPFLEAAGIHSDDTLNESELAAARQGLDQLGRVPLVQAHEFNLTPDGSLIDDDTSH
jgi:hypothetical protein